MSNIILTRGLPASGKTTWAQSKVQWSGGSIKRVAKDDLRLMFDGDHRHGTKHEDFLNDVRDDLISLCILYRFDVIVDETFVRTSDMDRIMDRFGHENQIFVQNFLDVDVEECVRRDSKRKPSLGEAVIRDYASVLEKELVCTNMVS